MVNCESINYLENCKNLFTQNHNFKVVSFNIRSIQKNFDAFLVAFSRLKLEVDVIVLTECWLSDNTTVPCISGYINFKTTIYRNRNSGIVVYVKNIWNALVSEHVIENSDCLAIHIPKLVSILSLYRSPSSRNLDGFLASLEAAIENNSFGNLPFIIAGYG